MAKDDFFERFRALHEMDGKAPLNANERTEYGKVKERFAEAICAAQRIVVPPGQTARATFRVPLLLKLKLSFDGAVEATSTFDVCGAGFGAAVAKVPGPDAAVSFELFLTKAEAISGRVRVVDARNKQRATFAFIDLKPASLERLERILFDEMLRELVKAAVRPG